MRFAALLVCVAVCSTIGWVIYQDSLASTETESKPKAEEIIAVAAVNVSRRTVEDRIELVGGLEPVTEVAIRSRVSGYLTGLPFDVGDKIDEQSVVVELDDKTTRELFISAEAAERVAQAQLDAQRSRETQARRQVERYRELGRTGVSTKQQLEDAESVWAVAQAEVKLEEARLSQTKADLERTRLTLEELQIQSPISGYVAERNAQPGDLARAEDILLRIVDLGTLRTVVNVVERDYGKIRVGQRASIEVDAVPDQSFPGVIVSKAPVLEPETRTGRIMIQIRNLEQLLRPGMHARVTIVADRHVDALVVPLSALLERDGEQFVFEVDAESLARRQVVRTGIREGDLVELLGGVRPEAQIVTLGSRLVKDGTRLDVSVDQITQSRESGDATPETELATGE